MTTCNRLQGSPSAYELAAEIRRFAEAGGWPACDLAARAQAEVEKRIRLADSVLMTRAYAENEKRVRFSENVVTTVAPLLIFDRGVYRAFRHPETVRRCDNCGRRPSLEPLRRMWGAYFGGGRGVLNFCDACAV